MTKKAKPTAPDVAELNAELSDLKILLGEISRNYQSRLEAEIDDIQTILLSISEYSHSHKKLQEDIRSIRSIIHGLTTKPERGRRKDLKKIEDLLCEIQNLTDRW